jgi:lambda family phage portal protein
MTKKPQPSTLLDRAIAYISPEVALKRTKARAAMALMGGYVSASYNERLSNYNPGNGDADADSIRDLRELRSRSRDLMRNSPIAIGAIETQVSHVVGTGLTMQSRIDAEFLGLSDEQASEWQKNAEREYKLWAESPFSDAAGQLNFYEQQELAFRSTLESGDCAAVLTNLRRQNWPFKLAIQLIEADRISNPENKADTDKMVAGIERNEYGEPIRIHIASKHPGYLFLNKDITWTSIDLYGRSGRRNVLHLMRKIRPGQTRGIPALAPIIDVIKQLTRYSNAEVDAAVNSAAFALFTKMDPEAFTEIFDDDAQSTIINAAKGWDGSMNSGKAVNLLPGESIDTATMNRPNPNFDPFIQAFLGQVGMATNIPFEVLTKKFQSSYSAARAALLDAWRTFKIRREWLASKFCQPVYEEWLADAITSGRIAAPGFFTDPAIRKAWCGTQWSGDGPGSIDPLKEASAAEKRMEIGLTTLPEEIIGYDGGDWETKHREQVRVKEARKTDGLEEEPVPPQAPGQPSQPGEDSEEDDDEVNKNLADAILALANRPSEQTSAPVTNVAVHLPQGLELSIPTPVFNVPAPVVNYQPPNITVEAPIVNLEATTPESKVVVIDRTEVAPKSNSVGKSFAVERDKNGKITGVTQTIN